MGYISFWVFYSGVFRKLLLACYVDYLRRNVVFGLLRGVVRVVGVASSAVVAEDRVARSFGGFSESEGSCYGFSI